MPPVSREAEGRSIVCFTRALPGRGDTVLFRRVSKRGALILLPIIYLGYVSLGLPDGTLGVAWPSMKAELGLPLDLAGQLMLVITLLAMASSFLSGTIIRRFKTGPVVLVSCVLTGSALLLISRANGALWLALASLPLGFGAGAVDSGLNGYVARHYSRRHMNWLHACWGIGATCGPLILTASVAGAGGWRGGFAIIGAAQLCLALIFLATLGLWERQPETSPKEAKPEAPAFEPGRLTTGSEAAWLSCFIFAVYVAVEGSAGLWANSVLVLSRKVPQETAGLCVTAYYGSITAGRILVGFAPSRWNGRLLVSGGAMLSLVGALLFAYARSPAYALPSLVALGLGFAPIFPGLMHEVPRRFVPEAVQTMVGRQGACAYFGAAFAPALAGMAASRWNLECIPIAILCGVLLLGLCVRRLDRIS